jgi:hypothetical protein
LCVWSKYETITAILLEKPAWSSAICRAISFFCLPQCGAALLPVTEWVCQEQTFAGRGENNNIIPQKTWTGNNYHTANRHCHCHCHCHLTTQDDQNYHTLLQIHQTKSK